MANGAQPIRDYSFLFTSWLIYKRAKDILNNITIDILCLPNSLNWKVEQKIQSARKKWKKS